MLRVKSHTTWALVWTDVDSFDNTHLFVAIDDAEFM